GARARARPAPRLVDAPRLEARPAERAIRVRVRRVDLDELRGALRDLLGLLAAGLRVELGEHARALRRFLRIERMRDLERLDRALRMVEPRAIDLAETLPELDQDRIVLRHPLDHPANRLLEVLPVLLGGEQLVERSERVDRARTRRRAERLFAEEFVERGVVSLERARAILEVGAPDLRRCEEVDAAPRGRRLVIEEAADRLDRGLPLPGLRL